MIFDQQKMSTKVLMNIFVINLIPLAFETAPWLSTL